MNISAEGDLKNVYTVNSGESFADIQTVVNGLQSDEILLFTQVSFHIQKINSLLNYYRHKNHLIDLGFSFRIKCSGEDIFCRTWFR